MKLMMKLPRGSVFFLFVLTVLSLLFEQTFTLPVLTLMILLVQQPLMTDEESCVLAGCLGVLSAVVYHLPFAVGILACIACVWASRTVLKQFHGQLRDVLITLVVCAVFAWQMRISLHFSTLLGFFVYVAGVVVVLRLWISGRSFHAQRTRVH